VLSRQRGWTIERASDEKSKKFAHITSFRRLAKFGFQKSQSPFANEWGMRMNVKLDQFVGSIRLPSTRPPHIQADYVSGSSQFYSFSQLIENKHGAETRSAPEKR
jgi:hypothetical protein